MKVLNLYGGPGTGKSTVAAGVFHILKTRGICCELAREFTKNLVYDEAYKTLQDQIYASASQHHKIWRLNGKIDLVITDSPIILGAAYTEDKEIQKFISFMHNRYDNIDVFIERVLDSDFEEYGRIHSFDESLEKDNEILDILNTQGYGFYVVGVKNAVNEVIRILEDLNLIPEVNQ